MFSKLDIDDDRDRENDESNLSIRPVVGKCSTMDHSELRLRARGCAEQNDAIEKTETEIQTHRLDIANKILAACEHLSTTEMENDTTYGWGI